MFDYKFIRIIYNSFQSFPFFLMICLIDHKLRSLDMNRGELKKHAVNVDYNSSTNLVGLYSRYRISSE